MPGLRVESLLIVQLLVGTFSSRFLLQKHDRDAVQGRTTDSWIYVRQDMVCIRLLRLQIHALNHCWLYYSGLPSFEAAWLLQITTVTPFKDERWIADYTFHRIWYESDYRCLNVVHEQIFEHCNCKKVIVISRFASVDQTRRNNSLDQGESLRTFVKGVVA